MSSEVSPHPALGVRREAGISRSAQVRGARLHRRAALSAATARHSVCNYAHATSIYDARPWPIHNLSIKCLTKSLEGSPAHLCPAARRTAAELLGRGVKPLCCVA